MVALGRKPKLQPNVIAACRRSFLRFCVAMNPEFDVSDFAATVAMNLQSFYLDTRDGLKPKILLQAPPQHGKSYIAAELFPAWLLGINPNLKVVVVSYDGDLALRRNISIQRLIESSPYKELFPDTRLKATRSMLEERNALGFTIVARLGSLRAVSIGMSLTGHSMDIGIIDDPVKSLKEARSPTINQNTYDWYKTVFKTRFSKVGGTVMMMTRWSVNDLAGRVMEDEEWEDLRFPAINDQGEALVESRHPLSQLLETKEELPEIFWEALYMQNPFPPGGQIIHEDWLQYYQVLPEEFSKIFITGDTAFTVHESCSYSVFSVWGLSENNLYMLDMWRDQVTSPYLKEEALKIWEKWKNGINGTPCSDFFIEMKSSGIGLVQEFQANYAIPVTGIERGKDKWTRLMEVLTYIKAGRLHLPLNAPWLKYVINEMVQFTEYKKNPEQKDDIVDTVIDALNEAFINANCTWITQL